MEETETKKSQFVRVKCNDCENEQTLFTKVAMEVKCNICGATLATPSGGIADIKADIVGVLDKNG